MSTTTHNINNKNNNNTVQTSPQKNHIKPSSKNLGIDFGSLFADAIETNTQKKKNNLDSKPIENENTQSMVWAQRNWNSTPTPNEAMANQPRPPEHHEHAEQRDETAPTEHAGPVDTTQKPANTAPSTPQQAPKTQEVDGNAPAAAQSVEQAPQHAHAQQTTWPADTTGTRALANTAQTLEAVQDTPTASASAHSETPNPIPLEAPALQHTLVQEHTATESNAPAYLPSPPNTAVVAQINQQLAQQDIKAGDLKLTTAHPIATASSTSTLNGLKDSASPTTIKTPVNQPGFAKELGQTVHWALGKNMSTVDIRVNPESFGPLNMRIVQKGQQVQLIIRTQDEASANLMTQAISGLKESMAQNGLQLNQVQIQHTPQQASNTSTQQFSQNTGSGQQHPNSQRHNTTEPTEHTPETPSAPTSQNTPSTGIDLFA